MTKHEYHIALVLIALITAGILGYHVLNGGSINKGPNCTLSSYISGGYNCGGQGSTAVTQEEFIDRIEHRFSESSISLFEFSDRRPTFIETSGDTEDASTAKHSNLTDSKPDADLGKSADSLKHFMATPSGFLTSEFHRTFIDKVYN